MRAICLFIQPFLSAPTELRCDERGVSLISICDEEDKQR
jgi:hypothetical protein